MYSKIATEIIGIRFARSSMPLLVWWIHDYLATYWGICCRRSVFVSVSKPTNILDIL